MRHFLKFSLAAAVLGLSTVALADQIDNSEYKEWASYKPGTSITMKQSTELGQMALPPGMPAGMDMSSMMPSTTTTTKLVEVKPDSLTLELTSTMTQMGRSNDNKTTRVVPAKIEKPTTVPAATASTQAAQVKDMKEGKEVVEVAGKKVNTITHEFTTTGTVDTGAPADIPGRGRAGRGAPAAGGTPTESHVKTWTSSEVPGGSVKMEAKSTVEGMGEVKTVSALIDFNIVK